MSLVRTSSQPPLRVVFSNRGLNETLSGGVPLSPQEVQNDEVLLLAQALSQIKIEPYTPISFKSIRELVGIEYVGYIVDKERLDRTTGRWLRIDEYKIIGSQVNSFKDTRVAYGQTYRYKIRSVVKLTVAINNESFDASEIQKDLDQIKQSLAEKAIAAKLKLFENIDNYVNLGLQHKTSSGQQAERIELFDGLYLEYSAEGTFLVSEPTINEETLQETRRNLNSVINDPELLRQTISDEYLQQQYNNLSKGFLEKFVEYRSFYYAGESNRKWQYVHIAENVPPPPPSNIKIVPNSLKKIINLYWLKPVSSQRDISRIKLYRKVKTPSDTEFSDWVMLGDFPASQVFYVDKLKEFKDSNNNIDYGNKYVYAFIAKDIHGIESFLSMQIQAELNPKFAVEKEEKKLKWISGSGVKLNEKNLVLKKFLEDIDTVVAKKNIVIKPKAEFNETSKNFLIRITSLDTHERKEFNLTVKNIKL